MTQAIDGAEPVFVRWRPAVAEAMPRLRQAIDDFDPRERPSAVACVAWLRERALDIPAESATRLCVAAGRLLGFYASANGQAELSRPDRQDLRLGRPTQPAVLLSSTRRRRECGRSATGFATRSSPVPGGGPTCGACGCRSRRGSTDELEVAAFALEAREVLVGFDVKIVHRGIFQSALVLLLVDDDRRHVDRRIESDVRGVRPERSATRGLG